MSEDSSLPLSIAAFTVILGVMASQGCGPRPDEEPLRSSTQESLPRLGHDVSIERQLSADEPHEYLVALRAGDYVHLAVDQRGVDVVVALYDPSGQELFEVDSPTGVRGTESVFAVVESAGDYRVEVRPWGEKPSGHYGIRVEAIRSATRQDRTRDAASRAFAEAEQLSQLGEADARHDAVARFEEALALWQTAGDLYQEAMSRRRLARLWSHLGEARKALHHYEEALRLASSLEPDEQDAVLFNDVGSAYFQVGDMRQAAAFYEEALRVARALGDRREEIVALNNLAVHYKSVGEPWQALVFYDRALEGWRDLGDRAGEASTLYNIGSVYILLDKLPEALDALSRSLEMRRSWGDHRGEAWVLIATGWVRFMTGETGDAEEMEKALEDFTEALRLSRLAGDRWGEANSLDRLGATYMELDRIEEALAALEEALAISRDVGDRMGEAQVLNNLGNLYQLRDDADNAVDRHSAALRIFQEIRERSGEAYSRFRKARAERGRGNLVAARSDIEKALGIVDSVRDASQSHALRSSYFGGVHDYYELYVDLLMRLHEQDPAKGYDRRALEAGERSRARSLLETLAEARADPGAVVDERLARRERTLAQAINAKERERLALLTDEPPREELDALEVELRDLLLEQETIRTKIRVAGHSEPSRTVVEPLGVREIQEQVLDEETLLLTYTLGEERSFLHLVSRSRVAAYELPGRAEIESAALRLNGLLSRSQKRGGKVQARLAAASLGETLLGPVANELGTRRLLVVADGALQYVPFGALPSPRTTPDDDLGNREPLVVDHEIVHLPSASVLAVLRRELAGRRSAPRTLAVLADPVFDRRDPRVGETAHRAAATRADSGMIADLERSARDFGLNGFERLPASRREAEAILAMVPSEESLEALGFAASRETVTSGQLAQYRIVHFATHGLVHGEHPELSGIVLSLVDEDGRPRDGFLRAHQIYTLDLPADLVVLSACRTALGKAVRGEGLQGLTRGFLYAGAARVVVSLWDVNDRATAELMERFYRGVLRDGLRPTAALRAAQVSMLREPRWEAPYYWAGFTLQGEWR